MERLEAAMAKARAERGKAWAPAEEAVTPATADSALAPGVGVRRAQPGPGQSDGQLAGQASRAGDFLVLPPITITPRQARRKRLNAILGPEFSSPYDILRSRVLHQMKKEGWTRLAVTSPSTRCGKSTISMNLALSLARHSEKRIILMDFDLRRPALATFLDLTDAPDISRLLRSGGRLADHAVRYGENLAICANRIKVAQSAELLQSKSTAEALDRIEAEWQPDLIIFDTPPMQGNDDNLGFFAHVDCALVVAAAGSSTLAQIDRCEQEVGGLTNILGTVLNKCQYTDQNTGFDNSYY